MEWWVWLIVVAALVFVIIPLIGMTLVAPFFVFKAVLKRKGPESWGRDKPSDSKNQDIKDMWSSSLEFRKKYHDQEEEIGVTTSDHLALRGLYYEADGDMAVIIIPGRPESCIYSLYYAYPYMENGVSVCCPDIRAHGESEGEWSGMGFKEQEDILAFAHYLHDVKRKKKIILHGICVGSCASSFVLARPDCPDYISGVFTDGMFASMYLTLIRRFMRFKAPVYPTIWIFRSLAKKMYGYDMKKQGPMENVKKWKVPASIVASKEDFYSLPVLTQKLFDLTGSKDKKLVWWEHGEHSHLRIFDTKKYDETVLDLIQRVENYKPE